MMLEYQRGSGWWLVVAGGGVLGCGMVLWLLLMVLVGAQDAVFPAKNMKLEMIRK